MCFIFLYGNIKYHGEITSNIEKLFKGNLEELGQFLKNVENRKDIYVKTGKNNINMINTEGNWVKNIDISVTTYIHVRNIARCLDIVEDNFTYSHIFSYVEQNYLRILLILIN